MTKWILHMVFSLLLFALCWQGLKWVSDALFLADLAGLDILVVGMLALFVGLFSAFFEGWLAKRVDPLGRGARVSVTINQLFEREGDGRP